LARKWLFEVIGIFVNRGGCHSSEGDTMNEEKQPKPVKSASLMRRVVIYCVVLLVVFLFSFVPMWLKYHECASSLSQAGHNLSMARIENTLTSAAIDARRGDYEPARQSASSFFSSLRAEIDKGDDSSLSQTQRAGLQTVLVPRDEIITLISRGDPASADRLSDLYVSYRRIMKR
jgi:hypothetical protein